MNVPSSSRDSAENRMNDSTDHSANGGVRTDTVSSSMMSGPSVGQQLRAGRERAGLSVDDGRGLSGVIDEQLFAGTVLLAHDNVDLGGPEAVVLAEPAVLEALRVSESIFLPE